MATAPYRWLMTGPRTPMVREPFEATVETHPLADINRVFEAAHDRKIKRRAVLVP
jgi:hypothetical protein